MAILKKQKKQTTPIHNSIQIWYEGTTDNEAILSLDINIWRLNKPNRKLLMDFGLKIEDVTQVRKVFMYFPFAFDSSNVSDLGNVFVDQQILKGIFNENYVASTDNQNPKNIIVKDDTTNKIIFSIYQFTNSDIAVNNEFGGTIISFEVKPIHQTKTRYYRFRLSSTKYHPLIEHLRPKNTFFESAFIETELLDFRINEKRNQDPNLIEKMVENLSLS